MPAVPALLSSPELAFVLLAAAALGIVAEVAVPGVGLGAFGALMLLGLSAWGLTGLSPRPLGLFFALLAATLLVFGVLVRGRALWCTGAGLALLATGGTLFPEPVSLSVVIGVAVLIPLAAGVLGVVVARVWGSPPYRGVAGTLVGLAGEVRDGGAPGEPLRVLIEGALWKARSTEAVQPGDRVVVTAQDNLELRVAVDPTGPPLLDNQEEPSHGQG